MTDSNTPSVSTWDKICNIFNAVMGWMPVYLAFIINIIAFRVAFKGEIDDFKLCLAGYWIFFVWFPYLVYVFSFWWPFNAKKDVLSAICEDFRYIWKLLACYFVGVSLFAVNTIVFSSFQKMHLTVLTLCIIGVILFIFSFPWIYHIDKHLRIPLTSIGPSIVSSANISENTDNNEPKASQPSNDQNNNNNLV